MRQNIPSRTQALGLLLAAVVALSATAGIAGIAGAASTTDLTVSITDSDNTVESGETTTVEIAVANASGGVGAAEMGISLSDPGVASITDVSVLGSPGSTDNAVTGGGQSADVEYAFADSPDTGSVTIVEVTLQAASSGSTDVTIGQNSQTSNLVVFDEAGAGYTLDTVGGATLEVTQPQQNSPPTADAGGAQTVNESDTVTLDASGSSDADGDALSYTWTQTAGPSVSLSDDSADQPTFTAPEVDGDQTMTFEVEVSDGTAADTDSVTVTVEDTDDGTGPGDEPAGDVSISLVGADSDGEIGIQATTTYDVVVNGVDGGVGAFELTVSSSDTGVATITDASIAVSAAGDTGDTDLASTSVSDDSATLEAALRDTADTGSVTIGTVTLAGQSAGTAGVDLAASAVGDESGQAYTVSSETGASLTVVEIQQVDPSYDGLPTDPDDDGTYEDVNGDGEFDVADVQALWAHRDANTITDFGEFYDFNNDGQFNIVDVQALWNELMS